MKNIIEKLNKAQIKYELLKSDIEKYLSDKILFDFFLEWQPSDGWTIVATEHANVAPLKSCLQVIEKEKYLNYDQFCKLTI